MNLSDFDYAYPQELVAQHPLPHRDASRMMAIDRKTRSFCHRLVTDLPNILLPGDLVVVNDSQVVPARLFGTRPSGATIELFVVEKAAQAATTWRCLARKAKRIRSGERIFFGLQAQGTVSGHEDFYLLVDFEKGHLERAMHARGVPPLPPYIERQGFNAYSNEDRERYQTIFATSPGSAAAPTAGLHFSPELINALKRRDIEIATITLHVGIDTFRPISVATIEDHRMHGERYHLTEATAEAINRAKKAKRRIIACGTTSVRALESSGLGGSIRAGSGITTLFIQPGYKFCVVDGLITNFHQPRSTLLILVTAFTGHELILNCYHAAIDEHYRLFSYGDCMVIT